MALVAAGALAAPIVPRALGSNPTPAPTAKLSASIRTLLAQKGYSADDPIHTVAGYQDGQILYLAKVNVAVDDGSLAGALRDAGATVRYRYPSVRWLALSSPLSAVEHVAALQQVTNLEADRVLKVLQISSSVTTAAEQPYKDQIKRGNHDVGADVLWNQGVTGKGVTVGVADSGIDSTHPDLDDQDWRTWGAGTHAPKMTGFVNCLATATDGVPCAPQNGYDDNGHGTHVAGIATGTGQGGAGQAGKLPGMAPGAALAGAKVCNGGGSCLNSSVMAGLQYLANEKQEGGAGADVINISLGGGRLYGAPLFTAELETNADPEAELVNKLAFDKNVVFTISAGNSGPVLGSTGSPGVASQAVSVGAAVADFDLNHPVEQTEHGEFGNLRPDAPKAGATAIAGFSSRGPSGDRLIKPDLTAPGSYLVAPESTEGGEVRAADLAHSNHYSNDPLYAVLSGTSMSSPAAAGVAALLIDGYKQANGGKAPRYNLVKAAMTNTAGTDAYETPIAGLIGGIRAKHLGDDPGVLYPIRNKAWVGTTGQGSGRVYAPSALIALTRGVVAYTPSTSDVSSPEHPRQLQPSWSMDDLDPGQRTSQDFILHGAPGLKGTAQVTFSVAPGREADGVNAAPAGWFSLPKGRTTANADNGVTLGLNVPGNATPGLYTATIVGEAKTADVTQQLRIPVQFYVTANDNNPAAGAGQGRGVTGPIWASEATDYSIVGFENPEGDIYTDWAFHAVRLPAGTSKVDFTVYDPKGKDHLDLFVFDSHGQEVDSSVSAYTDHTVPAGAAYAPTTQADPITVSIFDGDDATDVPLPGTVWVAVSDSGPDPSRAAPAMSTYNLTIDRTGGSGGTTPADRVHSGSHAWWSGSANGADSTLTRPVTVPATGNKSLSFWTWYELEDGYDWAYALVSTDNGATWKSVATTSPEDGSGTTANDPLGGCGSWGDCKTDGPLGSAKRYPDGFTGASGSNATFTGQPVNGGTLSHQVGDLSAYAGKTVLLRFAYTSDASTSESGFYVDDVSIGGAPADAMETAANWTPGGSPGFTWVTKQAK